MTGMITVDTLTNCQIAKTESNDSTVCPWRQSMHRTIAASDEAE